VTAFAAVVGSAVWYLCVDEPGDVAGAQRTPSAPATEPAPAQAALRVEASRQDERARDAERLKSFARNLPAASQLLNDHVLNPQKLRLDSSATDELDSAITALNARRVELEEQYASLADQVALKKLESGDGDPVANGTARALTKEETAKRGRMMALSRESGSTQQVVVTSEDSPELARLSSQLDDLAAQAYDRVDEILKDRGKRDK
jgi:hypothetical protein